MKLTDRQKEIAAYHAELAAEFNARRCACGAPVEVVVIGRGARHAAGIMLQRDIPDRNYCLACIQEKDKADDEAAH